MKAAFLLDQWADLSTASAQMAAGVQWKREPGRSDLSAYYPKGMIVDGDAAVLLCRTGQAAPVDDECVQALGMDASQLDEAQLKYRMAVLGIHTKNDQDLYRAGVIVGYKSGPDGEPVYDPGPHWEAYQQALKKAEDEEEA